MAGCQACPNASALTKLDHLCSDRVAHLRNRVRADKPLMGKVLLSPAPPGRWVTLREHTRVISRECRSPNGWVWVSPEALRYTRMVLEESLRLYPPTWIFVRMALGADVSSKRRDYRNRRQDLLAPICHAPPAGVFLKSGTV